MTRNAQRVSRAVTRLTVYRPPRVGTLNCSQLGNRSNPEISLKTDLGHISSDVSEKFQLIWWSLALFLFAKRVRKMMKKWCEALFEKNGCRKFALILEKPEIDENLPTPLSWDVQLFSTGVWPDSGYFPKDEFRKVTKRYFWKVSAHLMKSRFGTFHQTCPEMTKK